MMNMIRRLIILSFCAILALSFFYPALAEQQAEPGLVRILLGKSTQLSRMDIGVYGSYLINDALSFQRGSKLQLDIRDGNIWLYYEGAALNAGKKLSLKRQSSKPEEENGLRLNDSLSLLEGDLLVTIADNALRSVLHIGIEDYLKGLLPYEMSDSFPIEALKAQAVAARSYAMRGLRKDRDYDLSDDTNDQVYRGFNKEHVQSHLAVKATEGIVLTYDEQIIQAYYTASNGGQTESSANAWGGESLPYFPIREDMYDLENPLSPQKSFTLPKAWLADKDALKELESILLPKLAATVEKLGYDPMAENIRIDQLVGLEAHTPMYAGESRLMTQLRFRLRVSARRVHSKVEDEDVLLFTVKESSQDQPEEELPKSEEVLGDFMPVPQVFEIDLPIFQQLEKLMGLSINLKENEIISVSEQDDGYTVKFGRYGHGVGMSQRGAEWMASRYDKSYQDILAFYYPGAKESRYRTTPAARPFLNADYLATPGPIPTPTPRPTLVPQSLIPEEGQWEVIVSNINQTSSLNLRALPNTSSDILYQLYYGQKLLVVASADDGWLRVKADGIEGYVMESFVEKQQP